MTPAPQSLHASLAAAAAGVRRLAGAALTAVALGAALVALFAGWMLGSAWARPSPVPLLIDGGLLLAAALLLRYWLRVLRPRLDALHVAAAAERRNGFPAGALRGLLELRGDAPAGTSAALVRREEAAAARRLAGKDPRELAGDVGDRWAGRAGRWGATAAAAALVLVLLGFASPDRSRAGWTPLLHPVRHLSPLPLPAIELEPGHATVRRGEPLVVTLRADGRDALLLRWRTEGEVVREQPVSLRDGRGQGEIPEITAPGEYWVEAPDGAVTPRYRIAVTDALLLSQLVVDILYPAYLGLPPEHYEGDVPLLDLPAGTTLRLRGRTTRALAAAALQGAGGAVAAFDIDGQGFQGRWTPRASGRYVWQLRDTSGGTPSVVPAPLEVVVLADSPPSVDLTFPGMDTALGADLRQAIAADARDDHGVAAAALVSWRVAGNGTPGEPLETPLPLALAGERVLLRGVLDASARALVPGDTLRYFVRVVDGSPARQSAVSATYSLWIPGAAERRRRAAEAAQAALKEAEAVSRTVEAAERETRAAHRNAQASNARRAASNGGGGGKPGEQTSRLHFQETEQARRVAEQQRALAEQLEHLRGSMEALEESATAAGLRDAELQRRLDTLREQVDGLLTPELERELAALQQSLQALEPQQMQQALERLAAEQERLEEQLERALEQLRRAAAEQELNALSQEAKELATQQEALAREHEEAGSAEEAGKRAEQQRSLAERGEELAGALEQLGEALARQGESEAAERSAGAAEQAGEAQQRMEQAAREAAERQGRAAAEQGRQAAEQLRQAAQSLESTRRELGDGERQRAEASMQQATRDALALAQRQHELQLQMERGEAEAAGQGQQPEVPKPPQAPQPGKQGSEEGQQSQRGQRQGQAQGSQRGGQRPTEGGGEQPGQQQGGAQGGGARGGTSGQPQPDVARMRAEQGALQQGLEQLGRNVAETGRESGMVSQEVGSRLNRSSTAMQRAQEALAQAEQSGAAELPAEQAAQAVDALNRLALALLNNAQQIQQSQSGGGGTGQALQQLAELARQQSSVNGQSSALQALGLDPSSTGEQARRLGREQQQIAQQLGGMSNLPGGREDVQGEVDALAREADAIARELQGGRLLPEVRARQERLFHRLLDAGRSLEQEETSDERTAERPGAAAPVAPGALDATLLQQGDRYRVPTAEELRALPPAYRRLILDYFGRLNRPAPPDRGGR